MSTSANSEEVRFTQNLQVQQTENDQTGSPGEIAQSDLPANWLTSKEKWFIVGLSGFAALFSPLTANIYLPALPALSTAFHKSTELINLTVTMYLVFQGLSPMVWGPVSDNFGRRPISAICLLLLSLSCIGLALVPTNAYWLLMFLRCFQASGSASTVAIGAGIVGDISTRAERGGLFGFFSIGPLVGPAIGPIIGGVLTEKLGWRSIFWFLVISSSICFVILVLLQPETLQLLVESGRDNIPIVYRPLIPLIGRRTPQGNSSSPTQKARISKNPLRIFLNLDVIVLLSISALAFTVFYGFIAPFSVLLQDSYPFLNEADIGLCFLSVGVGTMVGSALMGKILNMEYARVKKRVVTSDTEREKSDFVNDETFPLEVARLRLVPLSALVLAAICAAYGWCIEKEVYLAVPLIMNFFVGIVTICIMNAIQTIIIDLFPGAIFVSVIDLILKSLGTGWTYVLMCGITLLLIPLTYLAIRIGPGARNRRRGITSQTGQ